MTPLSVPLDTLKQFPDELTSGCNGMCVGFTWSNVLGNIYGHPMTLQFAYAGGLYISGQPPTTAGEDPYAGAATGVLFGSLPVVDNTPMPALEAANFANYTPDQLLQARPFVQNGITTLTSYQAIANYLLANKQGVGIAVNWYESFNTNAVNGILPLPQPGEQPISKHMVACYDAGTLGLVINAWVGQTPLGGYLIMPETVFNVCFQAAYGYNDSAWRWASLVQLALRYLSMIPTILPLLSS